MDSGIILAAGLGTRMRAHAPDVPKPLVEVAGRPLIDYALEFMRGGGIKRIVVNTSYLAPLLEAHLCGQKDVHLSREEEPLETGGGVREALPWLGAPFAAINSDVICLNGGLHALQRLQSAWNDADMDALLLLQPVEKAVGYAGAGDFYLEQDGTLKRRGEAASAPYVFAGVQLLHPRLFDNCPKAGAFSMNVLYNLHAHRVRGLVHDGGWLHVGDGDGVRQAEEILLQRVK